MTKKVLSIALAVAIVALLAHFVVDLSTSILSPPQHKRTTYTQNTPQSQQDAVPTAQNAQQTAEEDEYEYWDTDDCPFTLRDTTYLCPLNDEHALLADSFLLANEYIEKTQMGKYMKRHVCNSNCTGGYDTICIYCNGVIVYEENNIDVEGGVFENYSYFYDENGRQRMAVIDSTDWGGHFIHSEALLFDESMHKAQMASLHADYIETEEWKGSLYRFDYWKRRCDTALRIEYMPKWRLNIVRIVDGYVSDSLVYSAKKDDITKMFYDKIDSLDKKEKEINFRSLLRLIDEE